MMHTIAKLGLAAALLVGGANATLAESAKSNAANAGKMGAGAAVDTSTTGSIGASNSNYGSLISSLQSGTSTDLTAFNADSTVNCVAVSSLQGDASGNAQALDNALTQNQDQLTSLRTSIEGNTDLMSELETTCSAQIDDFNVQDVIAVESGMDGAFTFYIDDRA